MKLISDKKFEKQYDKLPNKIQKCFIERAQLLVVDGRSPVLRIHALKGDKHPLKSMNVTGDYSVLFVVKKNTITFYEIGTHSELYR